MFAYPVVNVVASCVAIGPFVALADWCRVGQHLSVLLTEAKSDDAIIAQLSFTWFVVLNEF